MPQSSKPSITLREKAVALFGALTLAFTAWGFGGVLDWSLHIMLAGGVLTFLLAVVPLRFRAQRPEIRGQRSEGRAKRSGISHPPSKIRHQNVPPQSLRRPARTPAFYFAAAFLLYLAIAALNPAWHIASDERGWWLEAQEPPLSAVVTGFMPGSTNGNELKVSNHGVNPLPTSVEASYEPMNAWRIFNMHLAALSLALGLYLGLSSRRSAQFVLWSFLLNVSLMAVVAIAQKYTAAEAVLWWMPSENPSFWGSFFYRNQGAAFLNWGIVIAGVLYFYHARRSREEARSGGPHFLVFCLVGLIAVSVGLALSRGGFLFAAILVAVFFLLAVLDYAISSFHSPLRIIVPITVTLALLLSLGLFQVQKAIDWQAVEQRFGDIEASIDNADRDARMLSSKLTWRMAQDALWTGWGAGSFRYAFPIYQQEIPELFYARYHPKKGWIGRKFYRYAHNDILQFLAEYGVVGCSLLVLVFIAFLLPAFNHLSPATFYLIIGIGCAFAHAMLDFIFHSPSYWVALIGGLALASRLLQLEARRS